MASEKGKKCKQAASLGNHKSATHLLFLHGTVLNRPPPPPPPSPLHYTTPVVASRWKGRRSTFRRPRGEEEEEEQQEKEEEGSSGEGEGTEVVVDIPGPGKASQVEQKGGGCWWPAGPAPL